MSSLRRTLLVSLCMTAASSLNVAAQQTPVDVGSIVRLTLDGGRPPVMGRLSSLNAGALLVTQPDGEATSVAQGEILQAEVLMRRRNTLRGALIGGGAGLVAGLLMVATADDPCSQDRSAFCDDFLGWIDTFVLIWTPVTGAALGALVGTLVVSERWAPAFLPGRADGSVALRWTFPLRR